MSFDHCDARWLRAAPIDLYHRRLLDSVANRRIRMAILKRQPLFPHVIELNHQARRRISCSVYLIYDDDNNWALIDIGYEDAVDECLEIIRQLDFPFSKCVTLIASHADVDHIQGFAKAKQILKTTVTGHPLAAKPLETGDKLITYAEIAAQDIHLDMPHGEGRKAASRTATGFASASSSWKSGTRRATPTASFRSGWASCCSRATTCSATAASGRSTPTTAAASRTSSSRSQRIRASDVEWLLPSHGPVFRKDDRLIDQHDRPAGNLSAHGRLRHLRHRLAADGPVGARAGRRQDAGVDSTSRVGIGSGSRPTACFSHRRPGLCRAIYSPNRQSFTRYRPKPVRLCRLCRIFPQSGL